MVKTVGILGTIIEGEVSLNVTRGLLLAQSVLRDYSSKSHRTLWSVRDQTQFGCVQEKCITH